jgi:hypothetical protein
VTITTRTNDYKATATDGKNDTLVPLRTVDTDGDGNADPIDKIELNWFYYKTDNNTPLTPTYPDPVAKPLPVSNATWQPTTPPVMRFQLIPALRGNIDINNVNTDSKTVFLYPSTTGSGVIPLAAVDPGRTNDPPIAPEKPVAPNLAKCHATVNSGEFACSATIDTLPLATGGTPLTTDYYLRISSLYNNADYQIRLLGSGGEVRLFDNVAPEIDATGRASDVFRRVQSRVRSLTSSNPLTDGGFDVTKGICKNFNVPVYGTSCPPELINP